MGKENKVIIDRDKDKQPECCISCHACEKVCPQTIHVPEELAKFAKKMGR